MTTFKVSFEIEVDAISPLEAAQTAQSWMREDDWQFYVQNRDTKEVFSVDLQEELPDAVIPVEKYEPFIEQ